METFSIAQDNKQPQLLLVRELIKNPLDTDISFLFQFPKTFEKLGAPLFNSFLIKYSEIKSINDFFNILTTKTDLWEILPEKDKEIIINILKNNNLIVEEYIIKILNGMTIHFLTIEFMNFNSGIILKNFMRYLSFIDSYKDIKLKSNKKLNSLTREFGFSTNNILDIEFENTPEELFGLHFYLKRPARKPVSHTINMLLLLMIETAKKSGIKNHYSSFLIPVLREMQLEFKGQFKEITSLGKSYLMTRIASAR